MLKTFTAFKSRPPSRTVLDARFYKKQHGFGLIINFLRPVILYATENKLLLERKKKSLGLEIKSQDCGWGVFFQVQSDDLDIRTSSPALSASVAGVCARTGQCVLSVALLHLLTQSCSCFRAAQTPASLLPLSLPPSCCLLTLRSPSAQSFQADLHRP